jgi:hypothetical protein
MTTSRMSADLVPYSRTWRDVVREVHPFVSDAIADYLLWERTSFPFSSPEQVITELHGIGAAGL